ncbi:MAG: sigma-70 family RNA polymerase sigma factor, partial [Bacteroidota bacterium]
PFENLSFDPEQLLISAELHQRLHAAIDALPPKCRLIFKLIKEDGLKYKDVAELLQLSVKTVEAQMSIALKRVAAAIPFSFSHS